MIKFTKYNNLSVRYSLEGDGIPVVLLHGYLESIEIFEEFSAELANDFQVICIDIPGHGKSETPEANSMEYISKAVKCVLDELKIEKCYLFGHSMGGYATLEFASLFPKRIFGFGLLHSHPYADDEEKKERRNQEIEIIRQGKKELVYSVNSPKMFADDNLEIFKNYVDFAKTLAKQTPDEGIISCITAMKNRKDMAMFLSKTEQPFLLILGKKDNYIDYQKVGVNIQLPVNGQKVVLENSGHIGFIEEKDVFLYNLKQFIFNNPQKIEI